MAEEEIWIEGEGRYMTPEERETYLDGIEEELRLAEAAQRPEDIREATFRINRRPGQGGPDKISLVWSIEDVRQVRGDLSDDQAREVLAEVEDQHDPTIGVSWDTLEMIADELFPRE